VRFSAPVYPGETIRTEIWPNGGEVGFRARALERDVVALNNGLALNDWAFSAPSWRGRQRDCALEIAPKSAPNKPRMGEKRKASVGSVGAARVSWADCRANHANGGLTAGWSQCSRSSRSFRC
jgi:hypothetical protein